MKFAVIGHVEWTEFVRVARVPAPAEIVEALDSWQEPAGGGAVAAAQITRLAGECRFFTALGDDELGHRAARELEAMGLELAVAWRDAPQRRAFVHLDDDGERTITTIGERQHPAIDDDLPWSGLERADAIYVTAADAGALRAARAARKLVATVRVGDALERAGVQLDALVMSAADTGEPYRPGSINPPPRAIVRSHGAEGGSVETEDGTTSWAATPMPGPFVDSHGAGDSFAGGLTYGLGSGSSLEDALEVAAECGAAAASRRGPYGHG